MSRMDKAEFRKLKQHWEKELRKHGLGIHQPMTDNGEPGEMADIRMAKTSPFGILAGLVDNKDPFLRSQITAFRTVSIKKTPDWATNDKDVRVILLTSFPKLHVNARQRARAARWARIIYLYYRMGLPRQIVAKELGITETVLKSILRSILRAADGRAADTGSPRRTRKAKCHPSNPPSREAGEREDAIIESSLLSSSGTSSDGQDGADGLGEMPVQEDN